MSKLDDYMEKRAVKKRFACNSGCRGSLKDEVDLISEKEKYKILSKD